MRFSFIRCIANILYYFFPLRSVSSSPTERFRAQNTDLIDVESQTSLLQDQAGSSSHSSDSDVNTGINDRSFVSYHPNASQVLATRDVLRARRLQSSHEESISGEATLRQPSNNYVPSGLFQASAQVHGDSIADRTPRFFKMQGRSCVEVYPKEHDSFSLSPRDIF